MTEILEKEILQQRERIAQIISENFDEYVTSEMVIDKENHIEFIVIAESGNKYCIRKLEKGYQIVKV